MNQLTKPNYTPNASRSFYQLVWRWHFYAGLFVIPFLLMLSITGTIMLYDQHIQSARYNLEIIGQSDQKPLLKPSTLINNVKSTYPKAHIQKFMPAKETHLPAFVVIKRQSITLHIALNPYSGEILDQFDRNNSFYAWANDIHGSLLIGETGDRLIEAAAGLMMLLLVSGLYMWLPKNNRFKRAVIWPRKGKGKRNFYRELHSALGFYSSIALLFFIISGLAWTGIWGGKIVQPWSSFPMQKSTEVPLSTIPHSSLNQGAIEEMPWNLEQAPLPLSKPQQKAQAVSVDQIIETAKKLDMQRYQLRLPLSDRAVYSLTANTMSGDIKDPRLDRTVHIDQYSGEVLTDIGWQEYSAMAKFMAAGIALHQGGIGKINLIFNTLVCMGMIIISLSAIYIWWKRKPPGSFGLHPPNYPANSATLSSPPWKAGLVLLIVISVCFPLTGIAIIIFALADLIGRQIATRASK